MSEGAQALVRAVRLLRKVASAGDAGARLVELAKSCELHSATAYRILQAMTSEGLLAYDPALKRYFTGPEIFRMAGSGMGAALRRGFHPILENMAELTGLSAYLSIRRGSEVVCIDSVVGNSIVQIVPYTIGSRRPLGVGAAGLALLAVLSREEVDEVLDAQQADSVEGVLSPDKLRRMVVESRRNRFAYNPGLFIRGVCGLGIPLVCPEAGFACLSVVGLEAQFATLADRRRIAEILESEIGSSSVALAWPRAASRSVSVPGRRRAV